jgi:hypothetical protein
MKKIYILAIALCAFTFNSNAQIIEDNFDFYALGDIDAQSPDWRTWSDAAGTAEDADVVDSQVASAPNSLNISTGNDMLLLFGDYTSGTYSWQYDMYLNAGSTGFIGSMSATTTEFGLALYINEPSSAGDSIFTEPVGNTQVGNGFVIPEGTWVTMTWVMDLDAGTAIVDLDGTEVYNGDFYRNALQSVDIWDNGGADFYMDNVTFSDGNILDAGDFTADVFSVYPNPVKDVLNINSKTAVDAITVYDILGKVVLTATPGAISPSIDMSGLSSGAYLVNVTIGNSSKTVKVIK